MFNRIKSKLRSNLKILKLSKRYLVKYFSVNALDPRKLKSGDIDWDLSLIDFLRATDRLSPNSPASFLKALSQGPSKFIESKPQDTSSLEMAPSLLWLISHYISAPASSHGLSLAYIGREISADFIDQLGRVIGNMPTSIKLTTFSFVDEKTTRLTYHCGGAQSSFESQDLTLFNHHHSSDRNCAFVIDARNLDKSYAEIIEDILNDQRIIAYIALIANKGDLPQIPAVAHSWDIDRVLEMLDGCDFYLCTNPRWQQDLGCIYDLKFRDGSTSTLEPLSGKDEQNIPLLSACQQGICKQISWPITEFIADSKIRIYSLGENGHTQIEDGVTKPFFSSSPALYEAMDICVSGTSVIWKNQHAFNEADLSHDVSRLRGSNVIVNAPTHALQGEYFLAPTNNPHHSHLIFETLQHLHLVSTNFPLVKLLLSEALTKSQRDYFSSFGFSDERCVYKNPNQTYQIEKLYFLGPSEPTFNRRSIQYMRMIGSRAFNHSAQPHERIYLSRRDARIYRNLVNELEIEEIFRSFGFVVVIPSELSAEEKIQLFSRAKYIAGALGAAFTYAPFSENAQLIILTSNMYFPEMFPQMAALHLSEINYIRGIGLKHYSDIWGYEHCSFYLQPSLVKNALFSILPN